MPELEQGEIQDLDRRFYRLLDTGTDTAHGLLPGFLAARPGRAERRQAGRALRQRVPRSAHAVFHRDPSLDPVALIAAQNATRRQALVPLRMQRMTASPFAFLRGSAALMAADLATTPATGLEVMACGDMHQSNFGLFASAERNLVFAINDFDEVHPGAWEWDLKRLAASAAVAAAHVGGGRAHAQEAAHATVEAYVRRMRDYARMGFLEVWYDRIDDAAILNAAPPALHPDVLEVTAKARARGHIRSLGKLTETIDGVRRLAEDVPLVVRESHLDDGTPIDVALDRMLGAYVASLPQDRARLLSRYRIVDVARKTVGVGSVGTGCWVLLMEGMDQADPLFLQVKEARTSVLAAHRPGSAQFGNEGRRVVWGQRMIQGSPDIFLGWGPADDAPGGHYYVRQLADMKGGFTFDADDRGWLARLPALARLCGWALALAHAKSGDAATISGYCGRSHALADAIATYAMAALDQTVADHGRLADAVRDGRV